MKSPTMKIQWNQSVLSASDADYSSTCTSHDEQNVLPGKLAASLCCLADNQERF